MSRSRLRERILESLAGSRAPGDPTQASLPRVEGRLPTALRRRMSGPNKPAGVLIPLLARGATYHVLLTRRSEGLTHHAGQISFPGGRMEPADRNVTEAALREAEEEVGLPRGHVEVAGHLEPHLTITGYAVTPVIGLVHQGFEIRPDPLEVDEAFEVPLEFLMDEDNVRRSYREYEGARFPVYEYRFASHRIWGATASMLVTFLRKIKK